MMPQTLEVFLGDYLVGSITNLTGDRNVFTFDSAYVDDPERPTLSLSFYDVDRSLSTSTKAPQVRLPPFFANLLPEGHLRQYLARRAHVNPVRDFPLLWLLGEDLPGAAIIRWREGLNVPSKSAESVISKGVEDDPSILKFSLAGVQLKFSAIRETDGGLTIPVHGRNGDWILKMPSAVYADVPENEFAMLTFARAVGIDVPEIALLDLSSVRNLPPELRSDLGRALMIKRFDRENEHRIHIEDFNQIFNQYPDDKYKNVSYGNMLTFTWEILGKESTREFVRRLVFSIGIGNGDMHLKNWSVIYPDGRTPRLAPAYDYLSTVAYIDDDALALTIARTKQWAKISYDHLERFARRSRVPSDVVLASAREMVTRMCDVWPQLKGELDLSQRMIARIDAQWDSVPIFQIADSYP
jgi:serine/threonine-protein kinase HipA